MDTIALIPAYNEENTIEEVIRQIKKIKLLPIVINDCSEDKTGKIAKKNGVTVISHKINKGKGESIKSGLKYLKKKYPKIKYIVIVDADLQFDPKESLKLIEPLKKGEADYVIGSRFFDNEKKIPFRNKLGNLVWRSVFNFLFGTKLKDTNSGFIAFRKKFGEGLKIHGGYIIENSLALQAIKKNLKIKEVPVTIRYNELRDLSSGTRIVLGVLIFIIIEGIKYRFGINST